MQIVLLIFFTAISCRPVDQKANTPSDKKTYYEWNAVAAFLSGEKIENNEILSKLASNEKYNKYAKFMDSWWYQVKTQTIQPVQKWLPNIPQNDKNIPVFYPLSGADFINMYLMYPNATEYTMIAMEDIGNVTIKNIDPEEVYKDLESLKSSVHEYGIQNYFQTRIMEEKFSKNKNIRGILPVLLVFMKGMNLEIRDVQDMNNISLDYKTPISEKNGIKILFNDIGASKDQPIKTLTYFNEKLTNDSIGKGSEYLHNTSKFRLIMKSAVYLLQMPQYKILKNTIYNKSLMVIQDDSGIPYNMFNKKEWNIMLFGKYKRIEIPGTMFAEQIDLQKDINNESKPLPFQFGYGAIVGKGYSNLMIAVKRQN